MNSAQNLRCTEERNQSQFRMGVSMVTFMAIFCTHLIKDSGFSSSIITGLAIILFHSLFSIFWHLHIKRNPHGPNNRIYLTMAVDIATTTLAFYFAARFGSFFYPVFLWVIVGYGLRYGKNALFISSISAFLEFGLVLHLNEYWQQNQMTGIGLWWGILILPAFFMTVLSRFSSLNNMLKIELVRSKAAEKAKGEFLANMSHEIRTPLNGVLGMATILEDAKIDTEGRKHLAILKRSAESLLDIVNDILDFSKITSGGMTIEKVPFDLAEVLDDVTQILQSAVVTKGLTLSQDYPESMPRNFKGDPTRIRQIILNLAANAVKFTNEGSVSLSIHVKPAPNDSSSISIEIQDTGVGIPEDRLPFIFDQFEQAETSTTRNFGGTGLGLAISRHLAHKMEGDVKVESTVGEGSQFTVTLVLDRSEQTTRKPAKNLSLRKLDLQILVAEDNKINQLVIIKLLRKVGIEPTLAVNGQEALDMLDAQDFDLIFMDVRMPVMDGLEATRLIRARTDDKATIPVVALTADADSDSAKRCLDAGMNRHLGKPVILREAVAAMEELCDTVGV